MEFNDPIFKSQRSFYDFLSESYEAVASVFKEVGNPQKLKVLALLHYSTHTFSELLEETCLQGSSLSNYLNSLIDAKLVERVERGFYAITFKGVDILELVVHQHLKFMLDKENQLRYSGKDVKLKVSHFIHGENQMSKEIEIRKLKPMLVAAIHSLADNPENDGWNKLKAWAIKEGLFNNPDHPIYGFNNPVGGNHGYEFWMKVNPETLPSGEISIKKFEGGEYAVLKCAGVPNLTQAWKDLVNWRQRMGYVSGKIQHLEQNLIVYPYTNKL
ncbi:MAG: GyrI-like domain-containing protein [Candidatus Kariarchaeaceae archaeon]|jgi:DNA gyrase inhibitor GyrI/DNA-binding HxlR family transcriptional regulator